MIKNKPLVLTLCVYCLFSGDFASADVSAWLNSLSLSVTVGRNSTITIYMSADEPIIAWGLDLDVSDPSAISIINITSPLGWITASNTTDGDGLAALAFPNPFIGNNLQIATVKFQALTAGTITISISASPTDPGEGFARLSNGLSPTTFAAPLPITFNPSGACCFTDGSCLNNYENLECLLADGAYKGDDSTCQGDANSDGIDDVCPCACNCDANDDGQCDTADQLFINDCISSPSNAGCVNADVNCDGRIDEFDTCATACIGSGDGTPITCCGPTTICGACCDGGCTIESTCNGIHLPGLFCSDTQACRINGTPATCQDLDRGCCVSLSGQSLGYDTACNLTSSCCLPDGSCAELDPMSCFDLGGLAGITSTCNNTTTISCQLGCCLLGNSCSQQTQAQCNNQSGSFQGNGSLCSLNGCVLPPAIPVPPHDITKDRYLSIDLSTNISLPVAYQITREGGSEIKYISCSITDRGNQGIFALLVDIPEFCLWTNSVIHVTGCEIVPGQTYHIAATTDGTNYTNTLTQSTTPLPSPRFYGDVVGQLSDDTWTPPNNLVNSNDISAIIQSFQLRPNAPPLVRTDLAGPIPDGLINASDILLGVRAFSGLDYPFSAPPCCGGACNLIDPNAPPAAESTTTTSSNASTLNLSPSYAIIQPNESLQIDVTLDSTTSQPLIGYELSLDLDGGDIGQLAIESITIDSLNNSYAMGTRSTIQAVDQINNRIANLTSDGQPTTPPASAYLATFTLRASADAHGVFSVSLPSSDRAFIIGPDNQSLVTLQAQPILIGVDIPCTDNAYCDDANPCTNDVCNPDSGCTHVNNDLNICDDNNLCTSNVCQSGICQSTTSPAGTSCNDNLACTGLDTCDGAGICLHEGNICAKTQTCYECPANQYCCSTAQFPCACGEIPIASQ